MSTNRKATATAGAPAAGTGVLAEPSTVDVAERADAVLQEDTALRQRLEERQRDWREELEASRELAERAIARLRRDGHIA